MKFFSFSIKRPVTISVIILAVVAISFVFSPRINVEDFPKLEIPVIAVTTIYQGAGPEEVEEQITVPIEEAVGSVSGITRIESTSANDLSTVVVEFKYGTDMNAAAADVREKLDVARSKLPDEAEDPVLIKADPSSSAIVRIALSDENRNYRRLRSVADNDVKKELEKIEGIASVTVAGGVERAISVEVDRDRLEAYSIPVNLVASVIGRENQNLPTGKVTAQKLEFTVRSMGELKSVKDFKDLLITERNGKPIFLSDVATVTDSNKEVRQVARANGVPCVTIEIKKNTDANAVKVAEAVKKSAENIKKKLPSGFKLTVAYDTSKFIRNAINNLQETAIQGAILAVIMVLIFLGSVRSTLVIGLSIPISIISTFLLMYFNGLTINMMTLIGLILAVGNIVDASIVVLENIFRHLEMGKDVYTAAVDGAQEVGGAVLGAAMTNMIVFMPIFLLSGIAGQIFSPLAKTFIFAMICSLLAAVFFVPMMSSKILGGELERQKSAKGLSGRYNHLKELFFGKLVGAYTKVLSWCLNHRPLVILFAFILFVLSILSMSKLKVELQGKWDRGDFLVQVETPVGSSLERTQQVVDEVEKFILDNTPEYNSIITDIGSSPSGGRGASRASKSTNLGGFTVSLKDADYRRSVGMRSMYDVQDMITDKYKDYPGAKIYPVSMFSISGRKPIEIIIRGDDLDKLSEISNKMLEEFKKIDGMKNLDTSYRSGAPEYRIIVDRQKAADLGLGAGEVSSTIRILLSQDKVSTFRDEGNEYDIFVQLPEKQRNSIEKIMSLKFVTPMGKMVSLSEIAKAVPAYGPSSITRRDRARYVSVQADLTGRALNRVLADVEPILKNTKLPTGYSIEIAGEEQKRQEIFGDMFQVLFLAIVLVYVFLAIQFESFIHPVTIMVSVPLELAGVVFALLITNMSMTMFTLLGVIMLVGIVVSAAIVLIDYCIQRRKSGLSPKEAVLDAAPLRLRPILMTVGTTIIAMFPLALGLKASSEMFQPLAVASIGGLMTSTVLTLLVIPTVYSLFEDFAEKVTHGRRED